jgi:hypothetical protein
MPHLTPEERLVMTREFLHKWALDEETRSTIRHLARVLEREAEAWGDPSPADVYVQTCWMLAQPGNRSDLDELRCRYGLVGVGPAVELQAA